MEKYLSYISLLISIILFMISIWNFDQARKKNTIDSQDVLNEIKTSVLKANMKLDDQCSRIQTLQVDLQTMKNDVDKFREVQIRHDMEIKAIWKSIDKLNGKSE